MKARTSFRLTILLVLACAGQAIAAPAFEGPNLAARDVQRRTPQICQARVFKKIAQPTKSAALEGVDLKTAAGRQAVSVLPLTERAMHYVAVAREAGHNVGFAYRTLRGRNTANPKANVPVAETQKLFVEVTQGTLGLFKDIMGPNMVWPSGGTNAGHLYTMVADQEDRGKFQVNTYGTTNKDATASTGKIAAGLLLTDDQMDRFTRYANAGAEHSTQKETVFGYKMKDGSWARAACTNWLTAAPIGDVVEANVATDREHMQAKFTNRPEDLAGRQPLAKIFGLSRAQSPGIWMGKLVLAPSAPVMAVFAAEAGATNLADMSWGLGPVGNLGADGNVTGGAQERQEATPDN